MSSRVLRLLVVDPSQDASARLANYFEGRGLFVAAATSLMTMNSALTGPAAPFDVLVLNVAALDSELEATVKQLSNDCRSIILIGSKYNAEESIVGLESGADDYVDASCGLREILARVRAVYRRRSGNLSRSTVVQCGDFLYRFADYNLDARFNLVSGPAGATARLSPAENALLLRFLDHPFKVLTRLQLHEFASLDAAAILDRAIDTQISRVRRKLSICEGQHVIRTIAGVGYQMTANVTKTTRFSVRGTFG